MTLGFSTRWPDRMGELAGQPNYFPEKIHHGLAEHRLLPIKDRHNYRVAHEEKFGHVWDWDHPNLFPKFHTIRHDPHNRWRDGMDIHFVINNRTKTRFQFAPVVKCLSVQEVEINWFETDTPIDSCYGGTYNPKDCIYAEIIIDGRPLMVREIKELAVNDGFYSLDNFFTYFSEPFKGKIIHWTDLKY